MKCFKSGIIVIVSTTILTFLFMVLGAAVGGKGWLDQSLSNADLCLIFALIVSMSAVSGD